MQAGSHLKKVGLGLVAVVLSSTFVLAAGENELTIRSAPMAVVYIGTVALVVGSIRLGFKIGARRHSLFTSKADATVSSVTGAMMGLLAFILAFTFNGTMNRFDQRKTLYTDQVNVIETMYIRSELLPDQYRNVIYENLIKYVDMRVKAIYDPSKVVDYIKASDSIHNILWHQLKLMRNDTLVSASMISSVTSGLTQLIQIHNKRVAVGTLFHLPEPLWIALYGLITMAMACMGYNFAQAPSINWTLVIIMSVAFSAVILIVLDVDRSGAGVNSIIRFNQQAMIDLRDRIVFY